MLTRICFDAVLPHNRRSVANQADQIQETVCALIREEVGGLRTFVDRRIAELSAEVHATTQLMDFSESNLMGQLAGIREEISGVLAAPAASTRNSGFELEAVVQATEEAANRIMEAAEAIGDWLRDGKSDATSVAAMNDKVAAIFEACSFQDVTGQRIRRAIQHLQQVETMLTGLVPADMGPPEAAKVVVNAPFISRGVGNTAASVADPDLAQDAVDSLFD
jgi:chemotaxis protein CheZ